MVKQKCKLMLRWVAVICAVILLFPSCSHHHDAPSHSDADVPAVYKKIYGATSLYIEDDNVVIQSKGLPDHKSPYYQNTKWQDSLYAAYDGANPDFFKAIGQITEEDYTFRIPLHPAQADHKVATSGGPIGVSLNGVPFFNQYNGQNQPLTVEINTFDQYNGHPAPMGDYHYHAEPLYLTANKGKEALLGFLLDGFPVYGPQENGKAVTDDDLDAYHGHFGATADYPGGIYHYHITAEDPYIKGNGYYGTPGTVTR